MVAGAAAAAAKAGRHLKDVVTVSVEKPEGYTGKVGLTLTEDLQREVLIVTKIRKSGLLHGTKLQVGMDIFSINGIEVTGKTPGEAAQILVNATGTITIIAFKIREEDSDSSSSSEEEVVAAAAAPPQPSEDDLDEVLKLMGVSVHYLETEFMKEVEAAGYDRTATMAHLEGLEDLPPLPPPGSPANAMSVILEATTDEENEEEDNENDETKTEITSPDGQTTVVTNKRRNNRKDPPGPPPILTKGAEVLCPIDGQTGAAYVHCLLNEEGDTPVVGFANCLLIYANQYTVGDILDTLSDYCATYGIDPKECFVWMYCLSINLHRIPKVPKEQNTPPTCTPVPLSEMEHQFDIIKRRILNIGHVMVLCNPWKDPLVLKRCWCTLELYATQEVIKEQIREAKEQGMGDESQHRAVLDVSVVFPPQQKLEVEINMLTENNKLVLDAFYRALGSTKVQNAQAALWQDRFGVLKFVEENTLGRPQYNLQCNQVIRAWYRAFKEEVEFIPQHNIPQKYPVKPLSILTTDILAEQYAQYFEQLAQLFKNNEELDAAEEMMTRGRAIRNCLSIADPQAQQQFGDIPIKPLTYYNAATRLAYNFEDWDGAILAFGKTMAIFETAFGPEDIATGTVYHKIGDMLFAKSKTDPTQKQGAMIAYKRALDVQELKLGKHHPVTGAQYIKLGLYLEQRGKFDDALEYYQNGQSLLGEWVPIAVKPFLTLEKKLLLKGLDDDADLANAKGCAIRGALGISELEPEPESESESEEEEEESGEEGEEGEESKKAEGDDNSQTEASFAEDDDDDDYEGVTKADKKKSKGAVPAMEDPDDSSDDDDVNDLLAEYRSTLKKVPAKDDDSSSSSASTITESEKDHHK